MGTDNDVGTPAFRSDDWYAARAAEAHANLTDDDRLSYDQLAAAVGAASDTLSPKAQKALVWLATWHEPTIEGITELFNAARRVGAQSVLADVARQADDDDIRDHLSRCDANGQLDHLDGTDLTEMYHGGAA